MLIKALRTIIVPAGVVVLLTEEQLSARLHAITPLDDGAARLITDQQFKQGEELRVVGSLPICIHESLYEVLEDDKPARTRKKKADPEPAAEPDQPAEQTAADDQPTTEQPQDTTEE